ncbi:hypothetical protein A9K58_00465 [Stenotrophomonas maltophilia]|uniref:Uncharacterized protein n=1 Tax=Stenotrophomonas maltophilia TaxID=40324 RepID=A0A1A6Y6E7_STEMA|nr:hypothetical protein [Stenotrophomonas maltophilia]OBU70459.1 hypothetical protein A9K58_00465 [Stenotrophomonas maltophilia]
MCNPGIALLATTLITGAYQADQQRKQGEVNAQIAENNATLAQQEADASNAMATREMEQQAWRTRAVMGQQRAAIAANNVDPTLGTPADILGETALVGEIDQQTIRMNAARQAWGFNAQAQGFRTQAKLSRWSGNAQATGTILGSLASAASMGMGSMGGGAGKSSVGSWTTGTINNGGWTGGYA